MTALIPRQSAELSTDRHDPRDDWPNEAHQLADYLTTLYGDRDPLPTIAGGWIARQKSRHTRRAYVRTFKEERCAGAPADARDLRLSLLRDRRRTRARRDRARVG